jgi:MoaA/NifB/PqqE/SkfB family radical SAM enzyme
VSDPIRLVDRCNQRCHFCNVDERSPGHVSELAQVRRLVDDQIAAGQKLVTFSGGEPTLSPLLPEAVKLALERGAEHVLLQTNAVLLDEARTKALKEAGLGLAFVSLHAADPALSDRLTRAPGTHARTLRGIDNLVAAGVQVMINCVVNDLNHHDLTALVDLVAERWQRRVWFSFSFVSPEIRIDSDLEVVPPLSKVLPDVVAALRRAQTHGLKVSCADRCGFPPCVLVEFAEVLDFFVEHPAPRELGHDRVQGPECATCAVRASCLGVWRGYAARHGTADLRPLKEWPKLRDQRSMIDRFTT